MRSSHPLSVLILHFGPRCIHFRRLIHKSSSTFYRNTPFRLDKYDCISPISHFTFSAFLGRASNTASPACTLLIYIRGDCICLQCQSWASLRLLRIRFAFSPGTRSLRILGRLLRCIADLRYHSGAFLHSLNHFVLILLHRALRSCGADHAHHFLIIFFTLHCTCHSPRHASTAVHFDHSSNIALPYIAFRFE